MTRRLVDILPQAVAEGREAREFYGTNSIVVAIAHAKRKPRYWESRLR